MVWFVATLWIIIGALAGCGRSDLAETKIVGGVPISEHYPWFAQLVDGEKSSQGYCGGTLIAPRIVLTAAHCIDAQYLRNMHVVLGMADGHNLHLNHPIKVEGVIVHNGYAADSGLATKNDIAMLYLADYSQVEFERPIAPLPLNFDGKIAKSAAETARVIGLGNTTSLGWIFDGVIRQVDIPVIELGKCIEKYGDVDSSQICAGDMKTGGVDSCQGDSGGPLMLKQPDGSWSLAGIVSYGEGCAQKSAPGVYTRISAFSDWIHESMEELTVLPASEPNGKDLAKLLKTRCTSQFSHLAVEQEMQSGNSRQTIYSMNLEYFSLSRSEKAPKGDEIDHCTIGSGASAVEARWIRSTAMRGTRTGKVTVLVTAAGQTWLSKPQTLIYQQDRLTCQTSQGPVVLADQRHDTTVQFNDVFYVLGNAVADPEEGQTTWGCSVGNASIEVFELRNTMTQTLAARIHHRSIGTVTVELERADVEVPVFSELSWEGASDSGELKITNKSRDDIFTWKLLCPVSFSLNLKDGQILGSTASPTGSGHEVSVDAALLTEGSIPSRSNLSLQMTRTDGQAGPVIGCNINDIVAVETRNMRLGTI